MINSLSEKFYGLYRIESARLNGFDYGSNGAYFVTICTKFMQPHFGKIRNGIMGLSEIGCRIWECWLAIPSHFPFVILDEFVVMPDHVHGILMIDKSNASSTVRTQNLASLRMEGNGYQNKFGPQSKNLSSIIRGFKIGVTKFSRKINPKFTWHPRFHDRIIRNETELNRIRKYIRDNPGNWKKRNE